MLSLLMNKISLVSFILAFVFFRSVTSGLQLPSLLACAAGHAAVFAVIAALVASQAAPCMNRFIAPIHQQAKIIKHSISHEIPP